MCFSDRQTCFVDVKGGPMFFRSQQNNFASHSWCITRNVCSLPHLSSIDLELVALHIDIECCCVRHHDHTHNLYTSCVQAHGLIKHMLKQWGAWVRGWVPTSYMQSPVSPILCPLTKNIINYYYAMLPIRCNTMWKYLCITTLSLCLVSLTLAHTHIYVLTF